MPRISTPPQPSPLRAAERAAGREPTPRRPGLGARFLGWTLLTLSVGLVSCQSMFVL